MRLLIDTHVLIWWTSDQTKLPTSLNHRIAAQETEVFVSVVTPWEISIKMQSGKLNFDAAFLADFDTRIANMAFSPLAVTSAHGVAAGQLAGKHKDPFVRMLAAQALSEGLTLATLDPYFADFNVPTIWA